MAKVVSKVRIDSRGYKRLAIPKQKETNEWKEGDLIELNKVIIEDETKK